MRISSPPPHRRLMACAGVLLCLALGGCVPAQEGKPEVRRTPTSAPAASAERPVFASDEEALAAAEASYARYLDVTNSIANAGGAGLELLPEVAAGEVLESTLRTYEDIRLDGRRGEGAVTFDNAELLESRVEIDGTSRVLVALCSDLSMTRVVDDDGDDVTPNPRTERRRLLITFISKGGAAHVLIPERSIKWNDDQLIC